jgi:hypothetical protein
MDPGRNGQLGNEALNSFLRLAGCGATSVGPVERRVRAEAVLPNGRLDLRIETPELLLFVEVKVDAEQGRDQLPRYRVELDKEKVRMRALVLLTLPHAEGPPPNIECVHLSFEDLLLEWLPLADRDGGERGFLARYLKAVAMILGYVGRGPFERWTFAEQRRALQLVSRIPAKEEAA